MNGRRRNVAEEEEPLVLEMSRHYCTFHSNHKWKRHSYHDSTTIPSFRCFDSSRRTTVRLALFLLLVGVISSWKNQRHSLNNPHDSHNNNNNNTPEHSNRQEWNRWDYNAYHPPFSTFSDPTDCCSSILLAQQDDEMTDLTSLPNRAYAREQKLDYVRFREENLQLMLLQYDIIAVFPSHAVMIHLDHSLRDVLPTPNQVMTMSNSTGFFAVNLRHTETTRAMAQWQSLRNSMPSSLRSFLLSHVSPTRISYLPEHPNGFVGTHRLLQCLPRREDESLPDYQKALATTVASVCYRYYPTCEVL